MSRLVVVTGTSTGVGKTVATAAIAAASASDGDRVLVVKPVQTGALLGDSDAREVERLTGVEVQTWTTLDDPLAPDTAARRQGVAIPTVAEYAERLDALAPAYDVVVVEGAGGLLVRLDADGGTLLDLCGHLVGAGLEPGVVVVVAAGLGTLNHTELTAGALRARGVEPAGLVIGSWPDEPDLAECCNRDDLPRVTGLPMLAVLPAGSGGFDRRDFCARAPGWFARPNPLRATGAGVQAVDQGVAPV